MSVQDAVSEAIDRQLGADTEGLPPKPARGKYKRDQSPEAKAERSRIAKERAAKVKARKAAESGEAPEIQPPPSEEEIRAYALLGSTVWRLMGKMLGLRPLNDDESIVLGQAMAPVGQKYMPFLAAWMPEINLVVVVATLYQATKLPEAPPINEEPSR